MSLGIATPLSLEEKQILANLLATPDLYPMEINLRRNTLLFVQMSRESFRRSPFLDKRTVRSGPDVLSAEITQLLPKLLKMQSERPLHFILHGAFCGSTLLARHLEQLPHCFVLKEPQLLGQLSDLKYGAFDPAVFAPHEWADWFKMAVVLLARAYASDAAVIIKTPDLCNWMGDLLLDNDARTKIVFLCSPLKVFLLQVLKEDDRRRWLRVHMQLLWGPLTKVPFLSETDLAELDDGQCGAVMWLLNSFLCWSFLARSDSDRILPLNGENLICQPQDGLRATANFLGLTYDEESRAALATFRPLSYHSKDSRLPFDAAAHATDLRDAEARYGSEVQAAISWAEQVSSGWLSRSPFPIE